MPDMDYTLIELDVSEGIATLTLNRPDKRNAMSDGMRSEFIHALESVTADKAIRAQLERYEAAGYGRFPICMAKTQYSFSTDPALKGAPTHHVVPVREVRLSAGAGFIVVICGEIMTMPGLPKVPSAEVIRLNDLGQVEGLF